MPDDKLASILDEIIEHNQTALQRNLALRRQEMQQDSSEHLMLYELLGFSRQEGLQIDLYQNIGRFLYKYAGALVEEATVAVFKATKTGGSLKIPNTISQNPKTFQIDFFTEADRKAHEIKWRDATTDGDHVNKERTKVSCIVAANMRPVRVMYYMPNRTQARQIQEKVNKSFGELGEVYVGQAAWDYVRTYAGFDLFTYLQGKLSSTEQVIGQAIKPDPYS